MYNKNWIPVSGHWDDKKRSTGMTPSCPVHVSHKYLRNLPNKKKGKRSPVVG
ncbi:hypothetical protein [Wolbachia endosymbiont (group A) of Pogonocherus hispidulus]|uniref:hypothetical protein n=1 Tax=Wolbachia endosymbiont (group A) of Pogonocherus hispidulus TaxID=3066136 RepID=UPI0033426FDE